MTTIRIVPRLPRAISFRETEFPSSSGPIRSIRSIQLHLPHPTPSPLRCCCPNCGTTSYPSCSSGCYSTPGTPYTALSSSKSPIMNPSHKQMLPPPRPLRFSSFPSSLPLLSSPPPLLLSVFFISIFSVVLSFSSVVVAAASSFFTLPSDTIHHHGAFSEAGSGRRPC